MNKDKRYNDDDGRTIADMSGLDSHGSFSDLFHSHKKKVKEPEQSETDEKPWEKNKNQMSKEERHHYIMASMLSALGIAMVYIVAFGVLIFLLIKLWS